MHDQGVAHRDIKPENMMIAESGNMIHSLCIHPVRKFKNN